MKRRRLVAVELRPTPPTARLPQFLLPPATLAAALDKTWAPGEHSTSSCSVQHGILCIPGIPVLGKRVQMLA